MTDSEKVDDFYMKLTDIVNKLASNGIVYSDSDVVMKILRSLNDKFESKKCAIEESYDLDSMTPDMLSNKLKTFEVEMEIKKSLKTKSRNLSSNDSNLAFNSGLCIDDLCANESAECDLTAIDQQLALISKQFKKLLKVRNTYANRQGKP